MTSRLFKETSDDAQPKAHKPLGRHRILAPTAAVRVSPLCLGAMTFGDKWPWLGKTTREQAFEIMDYFFDQGGNFIDTANGYEAGQSEELIGEWMYERGTRDEMVLATKFAGPSHIGDVPEKLMVNFTGNHAKSMHLSLEQSLKRFKTTYIDLFFVHFWDFTTSIPELMRHLHRVVMQGKVLYLGISDTPAWIVAKANEYARCHGLTPFSVYQGQWNAAVRDFERDILPMAHEEGMALTPWGVLGNGNLRTKQQRDKIRAEPDSRKWLPPSENEDKVSAVLESVAERKQTTLTSVAIAYVMHKAPYVYPIIGCRKLEYLKANIEALKLELSDEEIDEIEGAIPFDVGFPMSLLYQFPGTAERYSTRMTASDIALTNMGGNFDVVEKPRPIKPRGDTEPRAAHSVEGLLSMDKK